MAFTSALPQTEINSSTKSFPLHAVFHSFLSDDSKQDANTTTARINILIELLKQKKLMLELSPIWENTDGCAEQYRCPTVLYLILFLSQRHSIIFDQDISAPGHGKEVIDGLNTIDKRYMYQLRSTVQIQDKKYSKNRF